jgi:hypothetical protein
MKELRSGWLLIVLFTLIGAMGCADKPEDKDKFQVYLPPATPNAIVNWQSVYEDNIRSIPQAVIEKCYLQANYCQDYAHGTAFVVAQGVVATNYHLADYYFLTQSQGAETVYYKIYLRYPATTAKENNYFLPGKYYVTGAYGLINRDMALLEVDTLGNNPVTIAMDDFWSLQQEDEIFIVSYPGSQEFVGSEGKINDLFLNDGLADWVDDDTKLIEHTAYTYYGSSGGPVFNTDGEIIGIHFAGYGDTQELFLALSIYYLQGIDFTGIPFATRDIP